MDTLLDLLTPTSATALTVTSPSASAQDVRYTALRELTFGFRSILRGLGVSSSDVVASSLVNSLEFVVTFLGTGIARSAHGHHLRSSISS